MSDMYFLLREGHKAIARSSAAAKRGNIYRAFFWYDVARAYGQRIAILVVRYWDAKGRR